MRTLIIRAISIVSIFVFPSIGLLASPQQSELLIVQNDTIPIYELLLPRDISEQLWSCCQNQNDEIVTSGNWRGYRGIWELTDDALYLVGFKYGFGGLELERLFPEKVKDGKVLADWYDSDLIIPKGEVLRWDGIFYRTYVEEEHVSVKNGRVKSRKIVQNYVDLPDGICRLVENPYSPNDEMAEVIFNRIVSFKTDWNALDERCWCGVLGDYIVTIGANGRVKSVKDEFQEHSVVTRLFKKRLRGLRFDIIKFNGKPYEEEIMLSIDLDEENNELELF